MTITKCKCNGFEAFTVYSAKGDALATYDSYMMAVRFVAVNS
jgi:hypothetical protein